MPMAPRQLPHLQNLLPRSCAVLVVVVVEVEDEEEEVLQRSMLSAAADT